jgi:hypothetical protein
MLKMQPKSEIYQKCGLEFLNQTVELFFSIFTVGVQQELQLFFFTKLQDFQLSSVCRRLPVTRPPPYGRTGGHESKLKSIFLPSAGLRTY